jgi:hypothetical protein
MKGKRKEQFRASESMIHNAMFGRVRRLPLLHEGKTERASESMTHMRNLVEYEDYLYYMKGKRKEQVNLWLMRHLVEYDDYLYNFEVDRKRWLFCSLCPVGFKLGWEDWLILDRVMDTPVCRAILTWNGFWPGGSWESRALLAYQNSQAR